MEHTPVGDPTSLWGEEEGVVVSTCMQRRAGRRRACAARTASLMRWSSSGRSGL
jgi:hypothetical protein